MLPPEAFRSEVPDTPSLFTVWKPWYAFSYSNTTSISDSNPSRSTSQNPSAIDKILQKTKISQWHN
jgi:hypothetical protein